MTKEQQWLQNIFKKYFSKYATDPTELFFYKESMQMMEEIVSRVELPVSLQNVDDLIAEILSLETSFVNDRPFVSLTNAVTLINKYRRSKPQVIRGEPLR